MFFTDEAKKQIQEMNSCVHDFKPIWTGRPPNRTADITIEQCQHCGMRKESDEFVSDWSHCIHCGFWMLTTNDTAFRCPRCQPLRIPNKVKRLDKTSRFVYFSRLQEGYHITKNMWACMTCGRVWLMKDDAAWCNHREYMGRFKCLGKIQIQKEK